MKDLKTLKRSEKKNITNETGIWNNGNKKNKNERKKERWMLRKERKKKNEMWRREWKKKNDEKGWLSKMNIILKNRETNSKNKKIIKQGKW